MYSPTVVIVAYHRGVDRQEDLTSQAMEEPTTPE